MFNSLKNNKITKGLFFCFVLVLTSLHSQNDYLRLVDFANIHIDYSSLKAQQFLDSIPLPIEDYIKGKISDFYAIKALIHDDFNEYPKVYQSNILALKYADKEKNYEVAGQACLNLFSTLYFADKKASAYPYIDKAKRYYELCDYKNGHLEIAQTKEYAKFLDGEYEKCNNLILKNLKNYKKTQEAYYYMFALYMLASNYIYLEDFDKAHGYFKELKTLKNDTTIVDYNYNGFEVTINTCFADIYYKKKNIDSTLHYLSLASHKRKFMNDDAVKDYLTLYADVNLYFGNIEASKTYLDSLKLFESKMFKTIVDTGYQINNELLKTESELKEESEKKNIFGFLGGVLLGILLVISILYFIFYRKQKQKLRQLDSQNKNLTHLKSNHEKLTVKVQGLEDYISSLKHKVKAISSINHEDSQREMIKEFYKDLHLQSSTIVDESNNHLELINDFNINFFNKLKDLYPKLNDSEIIICYYIYIGFKNKEIALFLNTSVRAIESKRYRITKKIDFNKQETTLVEFLKETFVEETIIKKK